MLINQAFGEIAVSIDAAVAKEGPLGSGLVDFAEVEFDKEGFFIFGAGLGEEFSRSTGDEALAPELDAVAGQFLLTDAIGDRDVAAVGDGVAALNGFPRGVLLLVL